MIARHLDLRGQRGPGAVVQRRRRTCVATPRPTMPSWPAPASRSSALDDRRRRTPGRGAPRRRLDRRRAAGDRFPRPAAAAAGPRDRAAESVPGPPAGRRFAQRPGLRHGPTAPSPRSAPITPARSSPRKPASRSPQAQPYLGRSTCWTSASRGSCCEKWGCDGRTWRRLTVAGTGRARRTRLARSPQPKVLPMHHPGRLKMESSLGRAR